MLAGKARKLPNRTLFAHILVEAKRRGPAIVTRLSGRAELFKERLSLGDERAVSQKGGFGERNLVPVFVLGEHGNAPSFQFSFWGNSRMYPRSGFRFGGTSAKTTLLETPFVNPGNWMRKCAPSKCCKIPTTQKRPFVQNSLGSQDLESLFAILAEGLLLETHEDIHHFAVLGKGGVVRDRCHLSSWRFNPQTVHFWAQNGFVGRSLTCIIQILLDTAFGYFRLS